MARPEPHPAVEDILPRVARREPMAMNDCIAQFGGLVWSIIRRYVQPDSEAEDVVQEAFSELWQKADRFDGSKASAVTFIGMIARRRSIDWLRRKQRRPELQPLPADFDQRIPASVAESPRVDLESLHGALQELSDEIRNLLQLHFSQGLTHHEISEQTGLPLGTVKTRLRRGLISLRALMRRSNPTLEVS
ncbi:MAG: sigma-70 family RNA polymerase sigma factor [Opitutaceae bacterium]